jgi:uracil-DNA glycosylase family 4
MTSVREDKSHIGECHLAGISGQGPLDADVMIVGVAPAQEEMRTKKVYSGKTGQLLRSVLKAYGHDMDSCYVTNLICWSAKEPTMEDVQGCLKRLVREIDTVKPKVILALGALPIQFFTGVKKSSEARGSCTWNDSFNCWVISTWQPTVVFTVSPGLIADIVRDVAKIDYIKDKPKDLGHVNYDVIESPVQAQRVMDSDWIRTAQFMSLDVECKWDPEKKRWTDDIRCLGISDGDITYVLSESALVGLRWPVNDVHWTFHNGMFDTEKLIKDQGVQLPICDDTMLMSYSLDERGGSDSEADGVDIAVGIHGLKRLSREYQGAGFYEVDLKTAPDPIVWEYNAKDAAYTARLAKLFRERQIEEGVLDFYREMILAEAPMCRDERMYGVYTDRNKVNDLAVRWGEEWLRLDEELKAEAYAYGWVDPNPRSQFNWNSPVQLKRFMTNYLDLPIENSQMATLQKYSNHPWVAKRIRIKKLDKQINTYIRNILENMKEDGRVHPEPSIHATVSGRKAYHKPPVGTIPSGAQYMDPDEEPDEATKAEIAEFRQVRGLFGAPKGRVFIEADYSANELWHAAGLSQDERMIADLMSGDFHSNAAEAMFHCKREDYSKDHWSGMRRNSKYVTFGVLFWRGAYSLFDPAPGQGGNLGKQYTLKEIEAMVEAWHNNYWQHRDASNRWVQEAILDGQQVNLAGRVRRYHAPGVYKNFQNMAANWPVQSLSHDTLIKARLELYSMMQAGTFRAQTLWDGHDAIYFEDDDDDGVNETIAIIREVMQRPRWFDFGVPIEVKIGSNWADAKVIEPHQYWKDGAICG